MVSIESFLQHHGVKGQKWGIRHLVNPKTGRVGASKDFKATSRAVQKAKTSSVKSLSNKELSAANQRFDLERKFRTGLPPSTLKKGQAAIAGILATGMTINQAIAFAKSPAGKAIASSLSKKGKHFAK